MLAPLSRGCRITALGSAGALLRAEKFKNQRELMASFSLSDLTHSIRFKILASLFVVLAASIAVALYGIWTYERDQFVEIAHAEAMRAGRTIEKALRASMLQNDQTAIQQAIDDIGTIVEPPSRISIVANSGQVAFSSSPDLIGQVFDRRQDPSCTVCHIEEGVIPRQDAIMIDSPAGPFLRNVIKIVNEPACYPCHPPARQNLGILLFDSFLLKTFDLLRTIAVRTILTGLLTFLIIIALLYYVIQKYIQRPIKALEIGFMHVGRGNYTHWVEVESGGEFADMADSFNVMTRAIDRFIKQISLKTRETDILYSVVQQISKTIDWFRLNQIAIDLLGDVFGTDKTSLITPHDRKENCLEIIWRNKQEARLRHDLYYLDQEGEPPLPFVARQDIDDWWREKSNRPIYLDDDTRVLIPLVYNEARLGLIVIAREGNQPFRHAEKAFMPALANHLAISVANARLYNLAITDGLTGLFSKRHFLSTIHKLADFRQQPPIKSFCLLMLDLDHFKEVNDTYGHPVGDQVLIQAAELIKGNMRFGDIPCRYGGEEFAILLPDIQGRLQDAADIANRLCRAFAEHVFICDGAPPLHKTVSVGVACFPMHGPTSEELVEAADAMLYEAKRAGRNQVKMKKKR